MNNRFKFRGKLCCYDYQCVYGSLVIANDGQPYIFPQKVLEPDGHHLVNTDEDRAFWVQPDTVGMYTGLKDKYGNLIYEGDIVKDMAGETYEIIWHNDFVGFVGQHLYQENRLLFLSHNPVVIVGNIHETKGK